MTDDHPIRFAAMLVHDHDISELVRPRRLDQVLDDETSPVQTLRVREDELELFRKLSEARRRIATGRDEHARRDGRGRRVLVVDRRLERRRSLVVLERNLVPELCLLRPQFRWERLSLF